MSTKPSPAHAPLVSARSIVLFFTIVLLWTALTWFAVERQVQNRTAALVMRQTMEIQESVVSISATLDRAVSRLQGVAAVLAGVSDVKTALASFGPGARPSALELETQKAEWTQRPGLSGLSGQLLSANEEMGVDVIWVMNASGDCVAASNFSDSTSFVGTNYADRSYFRSAQAGERGSQYAMGRVTKVAGLFFSAPVMSDGRFLGAVAVKNDLSRIASSINHPNAFVTDDHGVIILAADRSLEMRAMPGAAVHQLPPERRLLRYMRQEFDTYEISETNQAGGLLRVTGSPYSHIATRSALPQHGITVHVVMPVKNIYSLRGDALVTFFLLSSLGIVLTALIFGARAYVLRMREYRTSIEGTNESLTRLNAKLEGLAAVDSLTGLYNRRFMDESLEREVVRAHRKQVPLAVIMIDIDQFKSFNDIFGHVAGDAVLRAVGELMKQHIRSSDVACRYGGEEFLVVMPEVGLEVARDRANALRLAMHELKISHEGKALGKVTISLGLSMLPQHGTQVAQLVSAADAALLEAKKQGRDRLVVYC